MKHCHFHITASRDHRHMSGSLDCFRTCSLYGTEHLECQLGYSLCTRQILLLSGTLSFTCLLDLGGWK